jgi:hypothetical protein
MRRLLATMVVAAGCAVAPAAAHALPNIDVECNQSPVCEGDWFTSPVFVDWTVTSGTITSGCQDVTIRDDTAGRIEGCAASGGGTASANITIKLDQTPPDITDAVPDRPPDHNGWYTHPVTFAVSGKDATSGIGTCDKATYGGPDSSAATIVATCTDAVGHVASRVFPLRYDQTPPDPAGATADTGDRLVRLRWPAVASASIVRTPGVDGEPSSHLTPAPDGMTDVRVRNGVPYRYVLTLADEAGNSASREIVVTPGPRLLAPARRALLGAPPLLRWTPVRGARYYNVQLFRGDRKILSAWPRKAELQLKQKWRFRGRRHRLVDGRYHWYVWPGEGRRAARRYGDRIGARSFVIDRDAA